MAQGSISSRYEVLFIGGSAGSLDVLLKLLPRLPHQPGFAIVIILHRNNTESVLAQVLGEKTTWPVQEAEEKQPILPNNIYTAPADYHLLIENDKTFSLDFSEKIHFSRPAIDATLETGAHAYRSAAAALILSGANADGAEGIRQIKARGGLTMVQDPAQASVPFMPQNALLTGIVDHVLNMDAIIGIVNALNAPTRK